MDSRTVDMPVSAPDRVLQTLGVVGAFVTLYLAVSAILEATTAIDVPFVTWPF
jgi:hypothetical protein